LTIAHLKASVDVIGGQGGGFEVLCIRLSHCGVVHDTSIGGMDGRLTPAVGLHFFEFFWSDEPQTTNVIFFPSIVELLEPGNF